MVTSQVACTFLGFASFSLGNVLNADSRYAAAATMCFFFLARDDVKPVPPLMLEVRRTAPPLREGDEVLSRWSDEGWYYRGAS